MLSPAKHIEHLISYFSEQPCWIIAPLDTASHISTTPKDLVTICLQRRIISLNNFSAHHRGNTANKKEMTPCAERRRRC